MKKILTLLLALWMLTSSFAMAAGNQLVVGSTTAMSGAFFTDLFGSNTADIDVRALLHGYNLMSWDHETGTYQINDSVVAGMAVSRDAQNNRVYTFDLYGDLKFSDGSAITAKDYAFSILLTASRSWRSWAGSPPPSARFWGWMRTSPVNRPSCAACAC